MSVQIKRGRTCPAGMADGAFLATDWLKARLGRDLRANEANVFGRIARDTYTRRYGHPPYTVRVGSKSSQRTAYLPGDETVLKAALDRYRRTDTYMEAEHASEQVSLDQGK